MDLKGNLLNMRLLHERATVANTGIPEWARRPGKAFAQYARGRSRGHKKVILNRSTADIEEMPDLTQDFPATLSCPRAEVILPNLGVTYVSRQPILEGRGTVFGYELHFHGQEENLAADGLSAASRSMLDALALFGVARYTSGSIGFVNCGLDVLGSNLLEGLAPSHTVLEIPPCGEVGQKLLRQCHRLKDLGFRLALKEFGPNDSRACLLPLADYVKIRTGTNGSGEWCRVSREIPEGTVAVATDVHRHDSYRLARAAGLQYFQGYYFCNPELIPHGSVPADRALQLAILRELFKDPLELRTLSPLVARDPSLVYRLLRFVNSPMCAIQNPITSIESAIVILGDSIFRRIAMLAVQCNLSQNHSLELLRMALIRAAFCADASAMCGLNPNEMYLAGMLSLLPAMLRVPMDTILADLPLRMEIRAALGGADVKERCLLAWLENLEINNIAGCEAISDKYGLNKARAAEIYLKAMDSSGRDLAVV
jgi:EAL and modified HD-GYP domain-containing signal transduction protein